MFVKILRQVIHERSSESRLSAPRPPRPLIKVDKCLNVIIIGNNKALADLLGNIVMVAQEPASGSFSFDGINIFSSRKLRCFNLHLLASKPAFFHRQDEGVDSFMYFSLHVYSDER